MRKTQRDTLATLAKRSPAPASRKASWFSKLTPEIQQELMELREIWRASELVTGGPAPRPWTVAEVYRFVKQHRDFQALTENQFRPWLTEGK